MKRVNSGPGARVVVAASCLLGALAGIARAGDEPPSPDPILPAKIELTLKSAAGGDEVVYTVLAGGRAERRVRRASAEQPDRSESKAVPASEVAALLRLFEREGFSGLKRVRGRPSSADARDRLSLRTQEGARTIVRLERGWDRTFGHLARSVLRLFVSNVDERVDGLLAKARGGDSGAILELGELRARRAVPVLVKLLRRTDDEDDRLVSAAAKALGLIGDKRARRPLRRLLSRLPLPGGGGAPRRSADGRAHGLLDSPGPPIREVAIALGRVGAKGAMSTLKTALGKATSPAEKAALAFALGSTANEGAVEPLEGMLRDSDEGCRFRAVEALGRLREKSALPVLLGALDDSSLEIVGEAIQALGVLGDRRARDPIRKIVRRQPEMKKIARDALRRLGFQGDL